MNLYEHTIVARQDVSPSQLKQLTEKYTKIVEKNDGDIVKTENWGLLNLSYIIKKNKKGNYVHFKIKGNGKIIKELEKNDRGWYSGPIGWFDSKGFGEFYVALRSALVKNEEAHVFAGSGIVSESTPKKEWEETELKLQPIISALSGGQF